MDPDEALARARMAVAGYRDQDDALNEAIEAGNEAGGGYEEEEERAREGRQVHAAELADAFAALDEWLSSGGFFPAAWRREQG